MIKVLLLLLATTAWGADSTFDMAGCKTTIVDGSPEFVTTGFRACDIARDRVTGRTYHFGGVSGSNIGWVTTDPAAPRCGDQIVNAPLEQCDVVAGVGEQGVCSSLAACQPDCTCNPASPCGNGMIDAGEQCDDSSGEPVCQGRCSGTCQCVCACQDFNLDPACASGVGETCEFPPAATVSFGTAAEFKRDPGGSGTNCASTGNACAVLRDTGTHNSAFGFQTTPFTVECRINPAAITTTHRVFYKGSGSSPGYALSINSTGRVLFETSDGTTQGNVTGATSTVAVGQKWCIAATRNGTVGTIYVSQNCTAYTQEATGTVRADFLPGTQSVSIGGSNSGSGAFEGSIDECRLWNTARTLNDLNSTIGTPIATPLTTTGLVGYWKVDFTAGATQVADSSVTNFPLNIVQGTATPPATAGVVAPIASPFSSSSSVDPANCGTECGCTGGQICDPTQCICKTAGTGGTGATRYVDDTGGADTNPCTTGSRCATIGWVLCGNTGCNNPNRLKAGDTLILGNGTYPPFTIDCNTNANDGTQASPITIKAENERMARISSTGTNSAVTVRNCSWWIVQGLRGSIVNNTAGADNGTFQENDNVDIKFIRNLADRNNKCRNSHLFVSVGSQRTIWEENEGWNNSRHAFSCKGSTGNVYRRNYINNNGVASATTGECDANAPRGGPSQESIALYPCSDTIVEDNLMEGSDTWGVNVEATSGDWQAQRTNDNLLDGNISAETETGGKIFTRDGDLRGLFNTIVRNYLIINGTGIGMRDSISVQTLYDRLGVYGLTGSSPGLLVDDPCTSPPCNAQAGCGQITQGPVSLVVQNSLFCNNAGPGVNITACSGAATRLCEMTNNRANGNSTNYQGLASSCGGATADNCLCTPNPNSSATCAGWGNTGADCLTRPIGSQGPDIRCILTNGMAASGIGNSLWWQTGDTTPGGTAIAVDTGAGLSCDDTPPSGPTQGCVGGFKGCGATVTGINDGAKNCRNFAQRYLNQQPDGGGCPANNTTGYLCP